MIRKLAVILIVTVLLSSCVYTWRDDTSALKHMGKEGSAVITLNTALLRTTDASSILPSGETMERIDFIALELTPGNDAYPLALSDWDVTGTVNGRLSSTEVGTLLIWDSGFVRGRNAGQKHYVNKTLGVSAGVPKDGIILFTTSDYDSAYTSLYDSSEIMIEEETAFKMENSYAALYMNSPLTLPSLGFDLPKETLDKMNRIILYVEDVDESGFSISGEISMENEQSARTLCTFLRNLLIQEVRRNGEPLDVRALSGIFRYENSVLRISGYELPFDKMSTLLTKEI